MVSKAKALETAACLTTAMPDGPPDIYILFTATCISLRETTLIGRQYRRLLHLLVFVKDESGASIYGYIGCMAFSSD